jgi:hypothetical protein
MDEVKTPNLAPTLKTMVQGASSPQKELSDAYKHFNSNNEPYLKTGALLSVRGIIPNPL